MPLTAVRTFVFAFALALPSSALAVTHVWIKAGGTGDWSNPSNWSPPGPPSAGDDAFCTSSNPNGNFIFIDSIAPPALNLLHSVLIDENGAGSMTLQQPGFTLNTQNLTVGLGGVGTYTMSGGFA